MHWLLYLLALVGGVLSPNQPGAVPYSKRFEVTRWTTREGLPQSDVTALAQTSDGSLWVGTFGGLCRFDGLRFTVYDSLSESGLPEIRIRSLCVARDGTLWIGGELGKLIRYREGRFEAVSRIDPPFDIDKLVEDRDGRIWAMGMHVYGWLENDIWGPGQALDDRVEAEFSLFDMCAAPDGSMWFATHRGLLRSDEHGVHVEREGSYASVFCRANGSIWAHGQPDVPYVEHFEGGVWRRVALPESRAVSNWMEDALGVLWTAQALPLRLDGAAFEALPVDPFPVGTRIRGMLTDREDNLWCATTTGLVRMRSSAFHGIAHPRGMSAKIVAIERHEDDEILWSASYGGQLFFLTADGFEPGPGFDAQRPVEAMFPARDGSVWLAGQSIGIERLSGGKRFAHIGAEHLLAGARDAVLEDSRGSLWVSAGTDLQRWNSQHVSTWTRAQDGLDVGRILCLFESRSNELWIGGSGGIARIGAEDRIERVWRSGEELPQGQVRCFLEDAEGGMWAGTYGSGLVFLDAAGSVTSLGVQSGLLENVVSNLVLDEHGMLLLYGNRAVSRVALADLQRVRDGMLERVAVRSFQGGPGIEIFEGNGGAMTSSAVSADGRCWFPAREGVVCFDPSELKDVHVAPIASIESLRVGGHSYAPRGRVVVPPGNRDLEIEFAALTLVEPERARILYRLDGFESEWQEASAARTANYTRVPPGAYTFHVRVANVNGVWSDQDATLALSLRSALTEELWFQILLAVLAVLAIVGAFFWRLHLTEKHAKYLDAQVRARTQELAEARDRLEEKVVLRTRQLRDDIVQRGELELKLRESQKFEAVGRLAAGVAHDFNNVLAAILGEADELLSEIRQTEQPAELLVEHFERGLENIEKSVERAADMTRQLLAYSRQQVFEPSDVDLCETVQGLQQMLRRLVPEDIELVLELDDVGLVRIDRGQLEQVVTNLVLNARDAIEGSGRITIRTERMIHGEGAEKCVCPTLVVHDDGYGIDPAHLDKIFDPFFTTKPVGKGVGLGLASVHGIVSQSGGRIEVHSQPGDGAEFRVYFVPSTSSTPAAGVGTTELDVRGTGGTLLLCDDDDAVRGVTASMLERAGYHVIQASDPGLAIERSAEFVGEIRLLVSDMRMPSMSGIELVRELRQTRPQLRALIVSGYSDPFESWNEASQLERVAFLSKPFSSKQLLSAVERETS